jgi:hypothetical protein
MFAIDSGPVSVAISHRISHRAHRPEGPAGDLQRRSGRPVDRQGLDHVALAPGRADGDIPGHGRDRHLRRHLLPEKRDHVRRRDRPGTAPETYARAAKSFAREPEILRFLSGYFGPYPFGAAGGVVDADGEWDYALETQSRPIYTPQDFGTQEDGDSVVVHELAHQWYGDSVAVNRWQDIWLNEGFASYAEWLWSEHEGLDTARQIFERRYATPATSPRAGTSAPCSPRGSTRPRSRLTRKPADGRTATRPETVSVWSADAGRTTLRHRG